MLCSGITPIVFDMHSDNIRISLLLDVPYILIYPNHLGSWPTYLNIKNLSCIFQHRSSSEIGWWPHNTQAPGLSNLRLLPRTISKTKKQTTKNKTTESSPKRKWPTKTSKEGTTRNPPKQKIHGTPPPPPQKKKKNTPHGFSLRCCLSFAAPPFAPLGLGRIGFWHRHAQHRRGRGSGGWNGLRLGTEEGQGPETGTKPQKHPFWSLKKVGGGGDNMGFREINSSWTGVFTVFVGGCWGGEDYDEGRIEMLLHYCLVVCCWFEVLLLHSFTRVEIHDLVEEILTEIWGLTCNGRSPRPRL